MTEQTIPEPIDLDAHRARRGEEVPAAPIATGLAEVSDTAFDVELDEAPEASAAPSPVDGVELLPAPTGPMPEGRRPIVPAHLRPENLKYTIARATGRAGHVAAYHAVRVPWYGLRLAFYAARGLFRVLGNQLAWWWVRNSFALEQHAADTKDLKEWEKIHREVKATRLWRGIALGTEAVLAPLAAVVAWHRLPAIWLFVAVSSLVLALGHYGRPAGRTLLGTAVVAARYRRLNSDIVLRAYYAAGLGRQDKPDQEVRFGSTMARDARNTGSQVVIDLPYGKSWSDVLGVRERIASGLDVHRNQVFLTPDRTSSRRHALFVADRDPLAVPAGPTDLLDCKARNIWQPVRFGKDERDALVAFCMLWNSFLIGAQPRKGKTFAARLLALHGAADPWVRLCVVDGKASPDWMKFQLVAHRFVYGTHPNPVDADPVGNLLATLDEILAHIQRVNEQLAKLPVTLCPEGKLTEELARDPRFPDLRVLLLVMEEFQVYFETEDQAVNKDIAAKLSRIQAVGPSAGVIILSSSQKPSGVGAGDVSRLFIRYRDNHSARFALKCGNRIVSEAVLGGDAYSEGYDASALPVGDEYRGIGYLYGLTDATPTVRTFLADHEAAEKILTAARARREAAGMLTGHAAGQDMTRATRNVLADVLATLDGDSRAHWTTIAARLAERVPEHYADVTADAISAQLRALAVPSVDVKRDGQNLKGAKADDIRAAIDKRNRNGG